jgi:TPR repeat protein
MESKIIVPGRQDMVINPEQELLKPDGGNTEEFYRLSALQGNAAAQIALCRLYTEDDGVHTNPVLAYVYCDIAARNDEFKAAPNRALAARRLSPAQLKEAQNLSSSWQPGTSLPAITLTWHPNAHDQRR